MSLFEPPVIQTAIAFGVLFFLFSTIASGINELIASVLARRAKFLRRAITELLGGYGVDLSGAFFGSRLFHDLKTPQATRGGQLTDPSYIPAPVFTDILVGEIDRMVGVDGADSTRWQAIEELPKTHPLQRIYEAVSSSTGDLPAAASAIETWFENSMDRVSGWYRRSARLTLLGVSIVLVAVLNLDTIEFADRLWTDDATRTAVNDAADAIIAEEGPAESETSASEDGSTTDAATPSEGEADLESEVGALQQQIEQIEEFGFDLGWSEAPSDAADWSVKIGGLAITVAAIMLGAPFWFDVLSRFSRLRGSGTKPDESTSGQ